MFTVISFMFNVKLWDQCKGTWQRSSCLSSFLLFFHAGNCPMLIHSLWWVLMCGSETVVKRRYNLGWTVTLFLLMFMDDKIWEILLWDDFSFILQRVVTSFYTFNLVWFRNYCSDRWIIRMKNWQLFLQLQCGSLCFSCWKMSRHGGAIRILL